MVAVQTLGGPFSARAHKHEHCLTVLLLCAHTRLRPVAVDAHNRYRVLSGVANLTWDSALSRQAQAWADKCVAGHSGTPGTGENIGEHAPTVPQVECGQVRPAAVACLALRVW